MVVGGEEGQVEQVLQHRETPSLFGVENYRKQQGSLWREGSCLQYPMCTQIFSSLCLFPWKNFCSHKGVAFGENCSQMLFKHGLPLEKLYWAHVCLDMF